MELYMPLLQGFSMLYDKRGVPSTPHTLQETSTVKAVWPVLKNTMTGVRWPLLTAMCVWPGAGH